MANRVTQAQIGSGKIRSLPISPELEALLNAVGEETGLYFEVGSGGQTSSRDPKLHKQPGGWTGSHRHDDGGAADVRAYQVDGAGTKRYLNWENASDQKLWKRAAQLATAGGATGLGAGQKYMGTDTVHVGYGPRAVWGGVGKNAPPAPAWLTEAVAEGRRTPPLNIPMVASATDVTPRIRPASFDMPARVPALPRPRPTPANALNAKLGATGGAQQPIARLATSSLGWEDGQQSWNGRDVRQVIPTADNARARLTSSLPMAGGDPRLSQMAVPQIPRADPVGAGPMSFGALQGLVNDPANRTQVASLDQNIGLPRPSPMIAPGNLDLDKRKVLRTPDGGYRTENSISIGTDKGEVLIPTVVNGRQLTQQQAVEHFYKSGEQLGTFSTPGAATSYAQQLHQRQAGRYAPPTPPVPMQRPGTPVSRAAPTPMPRLAARAPMAPPMPMQRPMAAPQPPAIPPAIRRAPPATPAVNAIQASAPAPPAQGGGNFLDGVMGGFNSLKDQAGGLLGNAYNAVQAPVAQMGQQLVDAAPAMFLASPKLRGALIDPMVAKMFTSAPYGSGQTRYGNTFAERQQSAQRREALSRGRPTPAVPRLPAAPTKAASSKQRDSRWDGVLDEFGMIR